MFSKMNKTIAVAGVALALMLAVAALNTQTALASTDTRIDNPVVDEATFTSEIAITGIETDRDMSTGVNPSYEYGIDRNDDGEIGTDEFYILNESGERVSAVATGDVMRR